MFGIQEEQDIDKERKANTSDEERQLTKGICTPRKSDMDRANTNRYTADLRSETEQIHHMKT